MTAVFPSGSSSRSTLMKAIIIKYSLTGSLYIPRFRRDIFLLLLRRLQVCKLTSWHCTTSWVFVAHILLTLHTGYCVLPNVLITSKLVLFITPQRPLLVPHLRVIGMSITCNAASLPHTVAHPAQGTQSENTGGTIPLSNEFSDIYFPRHMHDGRV